MGNPIVCMAHPLGAPTAEGITANLARARRWFKWLLETFPNVDFGANWILWCESLDDMNPEHRARGLAFDDEEIKRMDGFWMVGGRVSSGMARGRDLALSLGKPVVDLTALGEEPPKHSREMIEAVMVALVEAGHEPIFMLDKFEVELAR
jgi:hypothetical protein